MLEYGIVLSIISLKSSLVMLQLSLVLNAVRAEKETTPQQQQIQITVVMLGETKDTKWSAVD
jgi:hypothetical protein